jgi:putative polysaccharide biosynthesis protein
MVNTSSQRDDVSVFKAMLRLNLKQLYANRASSPLISSAYKIAARFERIGRKKHNFHVMACPPLNLWRIFLPSKTESASRFIHRTYLTELWNERSLSERLILVIGWALWSIPLNLVAAAWMTTINGRSVARLSNKSLWRLIGEQIELAFLHNILPPWYYQFDLHQDEKRRQAEAYLHRFELKGGLYKLLERRLGSGGKGLLSNKAAFHEECLKAGLPTLPEIGLARDGLVLDASGVPVVPPPEDIFIKPLAGRGGRGAEIFAWQGDGIWSDRHGLRMSAAELMTRFSRLSRIEPYLIQRRARCHASIADLSGGALPTARVLTIKSNDAWEAVAAVFRMPLGTHSTVDNFHAGNIAANIDLADGRLGAATDIGLNPDLGWLDRHPDTGAQIAGRTLPCWPETLALAQRAHSAFSQKLVIGWDIAILSDGPVLVEGNGAPDTDLHQRPMGSPLGAGRFGLLLAALLHQIVDVSS